MLVVMNELGGAGHLASHEVQVYKLWTVQRVWACVFLSFSVADDLKDEADPNMDLALTR